MRYIILFIVFFCLAGCKGTGGAATSNGLPDQITDPDNEAPVEITPPEEADDLPAEVIIPPVNPPPGPACANHKAVGIWVNENDPTRAIEFTEDCEGSSTICGYTFSEWAQTNQNASGTNIILSVPEPKFQGLGNAFPCIPFNGIVKQYKNFGIHFFDDDHIQINVDYGGVEIMVRQ